MAERRRYRLLHGFGADRADSAGVAAPVAFHHGPAGHVDDGDVHAEGAHEQAGGGLVAAAVINAIEDNASEEKITTKNIVKKSERVLAGL